MTPAPIAQRRFGRHQDQVSILGLGGYHLGSVKTVTEAVRIVHAAISAGTPSSTTLEYHTARAGRMGSAFDRRREIFLMTKVFPPARC